MKAADLYETDFAQWALQNAELLRSKRFSEADLEHIAEEIEDSVGIRRLLDQNPSFAPAAAEMAVHAYADAARLSAAATSLSPATFPKECPFTLHQLLDDEFLP